MNFFGYKHNFENFFEKFHIPNIYKNRMTTQYKSAHVNFVRTYPLSFLSLLVKNIEMEIQSSSNHVDIDRGWILEQI